MICKLCNSNTQEKLKQGLVKCSCGLIFVEHPEKVDYKDFHIQSEYYFETMVDDFFHFAERYRRIMPYLKSSKVVLDIGASVGTFLMVCKNLGFETMYGVELNEEAKSYAKEKFGLELTSEIPNIKADLVHMSDVIEHIEEPIEELMKIRANIADTGILVITTPDYDRWITKLVNIKPKEHLFYFTKDTLGESLDKAGYDVLVMENITRFRRFKHLINSTTCSNKIIKFGLSSLIFVGLDGIVEKIFYRNLNNDIFCVAKVK